MQDYIINYDGEKKDDINDIAHFFKELLIDAPQGLSPDIDTTNKLFLTQFSFFQNMESVNTVNTLADNAFKHQITFADIIVSFINPTFYSFITLTSMRYNNFEFKGLLIDSGAATWSTGGLSQLQAL